MVDHQKEESKFFELMEGHKNKRFSKYLKLNNKREENRIKEFSDLPFRINQFYKIIIKDIPRKEKTIL